MDIYTGDSYRRYFHLEYIPGIGQDDDKENSLLIPGTLEEARRIQAHYMPGSQAEPRPAKIYHHYQYRLHGRLVVHRDGEQFAVVSGFVIDGLSMDNVLDYVGQCYSTQVSLQPSQVLLFYNDNQMPSEQMGTVLISEKPHEVTEEERQGMRETIEPQEVRIATVLRVVRNKAFNPRPSRSHSTAAVPFMEHLFGNRVDSRDYAALTGPYFLHGGPFEPADLQFVFKMDKTPELKTARIQGYTLRLWSGLSWSGLSALVKTDNDESVVTGQLFQVDSGKIVKELACLDNEKFRLDRMDVAVEGQDNPVTAWVFVYIGDAEELKNWK